MFRAIKQITVLIIFLMLTVFASLYFQDAQVESSTESEAQAIWLIKAVKGAGSLLSDLAHLAYLANPSSEINSVRAVQSEVEQNLNFDTDFSATKAVEALETEVSFNNDLEFNAFLKDFVRKLPALYFDAKIYSDSWQNFWSFMWLDDLNFTG